MLADPSELSGVLNKALAALVSIRNIGLSESESTRRAMDEFRQTTDPIAVWLDRHTVLEPEALISADRLWQGYNEECMAKGRPMATKALFGRAIAQLRPGIDRKQRTINGNITWCYVGLGRAERDAD